MKDTIRLGVIAGLVGSAGDAAIHWPAHYLFGTSTTAHYISQLLFPFKQPTTVRLGIGILAHFAAGAFVGVLFLLLLKKYGFDYPYLKSLGFASLLWIAHVIVIPNMVAQPNLPYLHRTEPETLVDLASHFAYGSLAALYLTKAWRGSPEKPAAG